MTGMDDPGAQAAALAARYAGRDLPARVFGTGSGALLAEAGDVLVKLHRIGTDPAALAARLRLAGAWPDLLLAPLEPRPLPLAGRWATVWPRVLTVPPDPDAAPWAEAGRLLAALHRRPRPDGLPEHGAARRLGVTGAGEPVAAAARRLPPAARLATRPGRPVTVVHGDFHLGQLGRAAAGEPWRLLDLDDLGTGDPVWDLARPAGFWAAGLLPEAEWTAFLAAYRAAGGPAVPTDDADLWPVLDPVARAAVVHAAAGSLRRAAAEGRPPDDVDERLLRTCRDLAR
jgi:aminoglycoside phosphotransferase (APT) family kinase protein